ncbi:winged helix-turn-helix domain-containing protein [Halosimplex sp. J119]
MSEQGRPGETDSGGETAGTDPDDSATDTGEAGDDTAVSSETGRDPTVVFELLADETRLAIVRELAAQRASNWQWAGMSFAELRRAVGVADAGNFSYHLEKLRGTLVAKDGGQYHLHNHGMRLAGAVASGQYTDVEVSVRGETSYDCPYPDCSRALVAAYDNRYFRLYCPDHHRFSEAILPPAVAAERTPDELVAISSLDMREDIQRARTGICPHCWGPTERTLPVEDPALPSQMEVDLPSDLVLAAFDCEHCGLSFEVPPGACVVDHPAVVAFYHDHGEDVRGRPYVDLPFCNLARAELDSSDPVRVRLDVELGDDSLRLWLDGTTDVAEYERV